MILAVAAAAHEQTNPMCFTHLVPSKLGSGPIHDLNAWPATLVDAVGRESPAGLGLAADASTVALEYVIVTHHAVRSCAAQLNGATGDRVGLD